MRQFQLVFRYPDGDWSQIRQCNPDGEPHVNGELIVDGRTYVLKGVEWLVSSDDIGDSMKRFLCTLAVDPTHGLQPVDDALPEQLRAALLALPAELVKGGACEIVKREGKTPGFVSFAEPRLQVYVADGKGKLVRIPVASTGDVSTVVTALGNVDAARSQDREGRE